MSRPAWKRTFLIIFTGQAFSLLGSTAVNFALAWWLTIETGSALTLTYAAVAAFLPMAVVGPFIGPFIDRWDRRLTMIWADVAIALSSIALIVWFAVGDPSAAVVIAFIALRSVGAAFHVPASQAAIPMYVPRDELVRVAGWNFFLQSGTAILGPAVGAFLLSVSSIGWALGVDVVGALIASGLLLLVRIPHPQRKGEDAQAGGVLHELRLGWRELAAKRGLLALALVLAVTVFFYIPVSSLFPLMTFGHFGGRAIHASLIEACFGGGMLAGGVLIGIAGRRLSGVGTISGGVALLGFMLLVSGLLPGGAFAAFAVVYVVMGLAVPLFSAPIQALYQRLIEPSMLGRVSSLVGTITLLAAPVGLLIAGPVAERFGVPLWFAVAGVVSIGVSVACYRWPSIRAVAATPAPAVGPAGDEGGGVVANALDEASP